MEERDPKSYAIIGAAMEVHRELGPGLLEAAYQEALGLELNDRSVPFEEQVALPVRYKRHTLKSSYRADFVCFGDVLVEIKAIKALGELEEAQLIHYLKITGIPTGLLINFGKTSLEFKRFKN